MPDFRTCKSVPVSIDKCKLRTEGISSEGNTRIVAGIRADSIVMRSAATGGRNGVSGERISASRRHPCHAKAARLAGARGCRNCVSSDLNTGRRGPQIAVVEFKLYAVGAATLAASILRILGQFYYVNRVLRNGHVVGIDVDPASALRMAIVVGYGGVVRGNVDAEIVGVVRVHADIVAADRAVLVDGSYAALRRTDDGVVFNQVSASRLVAILADINGLPLKGRTRRQRALPRLLDVLHVVVNRIFLNPHANGQITGNIELRPRVLEDCGDIVNIRSGTEVPLTELKHRTERTAARRLPDRPAVNLQSSMSAAAIPGDPRVVCRPAIVSLDRGLIG